MLAKIRLCRSSIYCIGLSTILLALTIGDPGSARILQYWPGIGIIRRCHNCRVKTEISDTRSFAFQDKIICGGQFSRFTKLAGVQLRTVFKVFVSATNTRLQRFESRYHSDTDGNCSLCAKSDKRKISG